MIIMRYKASDFYVSRIPLLPIENFFNQFNTGEHSFDRKEWMKNQFECPAPQAGWWRPAE